MEAIARQLDAAGRRARRLLVMRRLFQFVAVAGPACVGLGLVDWLLRLPGWFRLIVLSGMLAAAGVWLVGRLGRALRFGPSVSELALRAERLFPELRGWLASGIELSSAGTSLVGGDGVGAGLARATVREAERRVAGRSFAGLVDARAARRSSAWALVGLVVLLGAVSASPGSAKVAAQRWLLPLGDAAWPKRVGVEPVDWPAVLAADTPARLMAEVTVRQAGGEVSRVWLAYRFEHRPDDGPAWVGPTQRVLMNPLNPSHGSAEQQAEAVARPRFSALVDPPPELARRLGGGGAAGALVATLEAGDDATDAVIVPVVLRPGLAWARATVVPPDYARAFLPAQELELAATAERLGSITALRGSRLALRLGLTKPMSANPAEARAWFEGLSPAATLEMAETPEAGAGAGAGLVLRQTLGEAETISLLLADAYGLTDTATRRLRLTPTPDAPPTVGLLEPSTDLSLLATAELPVRAVASDDVSLTGLSVTVTEPMRGERLEAADTAEAVVTLATQPGPDRELTAAATLKLADYDLRPGDVVVLDAFAQDVFDPSLGDRPATWAVPRRLTIIDAATLLDEVQRELSAVRRTAERLRVEQSGLRRAEPDRPADLAAPQQRLTRGLTPASSRLEAAQRRLAQNGLREAELDELIATADRLLDEAGEASDRAAERFGDDTPAAEAQARAAQAQAEEKLAAVAELLDRGGDALSLRLEIGSLRAQQEGLAMDTRALLPQTAGRSLEELTEAQRAEVEALAERQAELARQGEALVRRMSSTAEALQQSSERDADQAAAEALAEAAEVARRAGLAQQMQQGAEQAHQNRLSQAGQAQNEALDTLDRMLEQMGQQEAKRRERLERRLRELAERIARLLADQRVLSDRLPGPPEGPEAPEAAEAAEAGIVAVEDEAALEPAGVVLDEQGVALVQGLAEPQASLWQRVVVVQTEAEREPATETVAPVLGEAAGAAAQAVGSLRAAAVVEAGGHQVAAIEALERALEAVKQAQQEQREQDAQAQRAKLREAYLALAERQEVLRGEALGWAERDAAGGLDRRGRAEARALAEPQAALGAEVEALRERVAGQVVFEAMHDRVGRSVGTAVTGLRGGAEVSLDGVPGSQAEVSAGLRAMAEALTAPPPKNDFADQPQDQGGGGGGGGASAEVIPDAAQLKLLRGVQAGLMEGTATAGVALAEAPQDASARERVADLAERQRELSMLAERLKREMDRKRRELEASPMPVPVPEMELPREGADDAPE